MTNTIQINNNNFKISDIFLIATTRVKQSELGTYRNIVVYQNNQVPTVVKNGTSEEITETIKDYQQTLYENEIYNFALLNDRFLVNIENVRDLSVSNYKDSYTATANFKSGASIELYSSQNQEDIDFFISSYNEQKEIFINNNCKPLVLDSQCEENINDDLPEDK